MTEIKKIIGIFGMPRSGTSFVAQIFDSHPEVAFRMEPIFSYALKNSVNEHATKAEFESFFEKAFNAKDDVFMNQLENRAKGIYPTFKKEKNASVLVFKTTRFHEIIPALLKNFSPEFMKIVSIVRHPCGAINSWLNHPNEFPPEADKMQEWRSGACRKTAKEEYWGFNDWLKVTQLHQQYEKKHLNFKVFQYENFVQNIHYETENLFDFTGLDINKQTRGFISQCQSREDTDPYSVYKTKDAAGKWKFQLNEKIKDAIIHDAVKMGLGKYLVSV